MNKQRFFCLMIFLYCWHADAVSEQVRQGILDPNFIFYLIAVTLPFIIFGLVVYLLYF